MSKRVNCSAPVEHFRAVRLGPEPFLVIHTLPQFLLDNPIALQKKYLKIKDGVGDEVYSLGPSDFFFLIHQGEIC